MSSPFIYFTFVCLEISQIFPALFWLTVVSIKKKEITRFLLRGLLKSFSPANTYCFMNVLLQRGHLKCRIFYTRLHIITCTGTVWGYTYADDLLSHSCESSAKQATLKAHNCIRCLCMLDF